MKSLFKSKMKKLKTLEQVSWWPFPTKQKTSAKHIDYVLNFEYLAHIFVNLDVIPISRSLFGFCFVLLLHRWKTVYPTKVRAQSVNAKSANKIHLCFFFTFYFAIIAYLSLSSVAFFWAPDFSRKGPINLCLSVRLKPVLL